jgi:hypothetical protein
MSLYSSSLTTNVLSNRLKQVVRLPIIVVSLGLILYYTIYLAALVPSGDFEHIWLPDNIMVVQTVYESSPVVGQLQQGDIILEIDKKPAIWTIFRPLFTPGQQSYEYTVQRGDQTFSVMDSAAPPSFSVIRRRAVSGLVALFTWLVGSLIILFATPDNRDAWQLGITTTAVAIAIAASEAALYGVPGGWIGSSPLLPLIAVAWIEVALLPRGGPPSSRERSIFGILYAIAAFLGFVALYELIFLAPNGSSIQIIIGVSSYDVLLA